VGTVTAPPWGHKPPSVDDPEDYWTSPPPEPSPRCQYWVRRYREGTWRPNKWVRIQGYYGTALKLGVYIWEGNNVIAELIAKDCERRITG
jgi:hypothetical protein